MKPSRTSSTTPDRVARASVRARTLVGLCVAAGLLLVGGGAVTQMNAAPLGATALLATDDGYVDASRPAKSFGNAATLRVDARPVVRSYLKFDTSSIDGTITSAVPPRSGPEGRSSS